MFEDAIFDSNGTIHTRSRGWMLATFTFNASILLTLILVPLVFPDALPHVAGAFLMVAPSVPVPEVKPLVERAAPAPTQIHDGRIEAPSVIPHSFTILDKPEALPAINAANMEAGGSPTAAARVFRTNSAHPVVRPAVSGPVRVSSMVVQGLLIRKTIPAYPAIAKATGTQGVVVLQATISRQGTIENLRVVSGPQLLREAALEAVRSWRYRPFLLNGEPVEVDTTVNVDFTLQ